jgi:hypothetical protein
MSATLSGDAIFSLAQEAYGDTPLYFDKPRILALFEDWRDLGRPVTASELDRLVDLLVALDTRPDKGGRPSGAAPSFPSPKSTTPAA